jgi:hypothetical protein
MQEDIMNWFGVWDRGLRARRWLRAGMAVASIGVVCLAPAAWGKEPSLTAIELYDGASGAAYVQLTDVLINGKAELRNCAAAGAGAIEKSEYGKLPKLQMAAGGVLERGEDGVLRYNAGDGTAFCVLPENVKFEHNASFAPAAIADMADLRGRALAPGTDGAAAAQPLKKGVKLVFVAAADAEKADYLLADRVGTQAGWQAYLAKYPAATHTDAAKHALAGLYLDAGSKALAAYEKSAKTDAPSYADLKAARAQVNLAHLLLPNSEGEVKLAGGIGADLTALTDKGQAELDAYRAALAAKTAGYAHLQKAKVLVEAVQEVDGTFAPLAKLRDGVAVAGDALESALHAAEQAAAAKKWDEAVGRVEPYRAFGPEEPRVARVIDGAYAAYYQQGQQLDATKEWKGSIDAYEHALKAKETTEANEALKAAKKELAAAEDDTAAKAALEKSKTYELQKDMIPAYETLTSLTESQQALVRDDITRLEPAYVTAAAQRAKEIAQAYPTIGGIGDEKAVENAYAYLERAYELSTVDADKQGYQLRMQNLADELSTWFLDRAKHSLQKPLGSGTELGWAYLKEAEAYKAANLEAVRDQMKLAEPAHGMHSRLSIRVQFRDQTSQRQSEGFASQMESAIAANLDTPGMQVKVIRSTDATRPDLDPDFLIAGDVLEHNISMPPTVESVDSTYVAGVHDIPSDEWNKLNRQYDAANDELRTAQAALQGAEAKGNKKAVNEANKQVGEAQARVNDLRARLDATAKSRTEDIIRPYSYKKTTYNVLNRIVLQFRLDDALSGEKGEPVQVTKEERKQFVVTSEVKSEDANKVKNEGTLPDREELQNELENVAREELIKKVQAKVVELPAKIYQDAEKREHDGYSDDAGEAYMRYLNVAPAEPTAERTHAEKFLREQFNFQVFPGEVRESPRALPAVEKGRE